MLRLTPLVLTLAISVAAAAFAQDDPEGKLQVRAVFTSTYSTRASETTSNKIGNVTTGRNRRDEMWDRVTLIYTSTTTWKYKDGVPVDMQDSAKVSCSGQGGLSNLTNYVTAVNKGGEWAPYKYLSSEDGQWTYSVPSEPSRKGMPPLMASVGSVVVTPPVGMYTLILGPYPNIDKLSRTGSWAQRLRPKKGGGDRDQEDQEFPIDDDHIPPGDPRARYLIGDAWSAMTELLQPATGIQGTYDTEKGEFSVSGHITDHGGPGTQTTRTKPVDDGDRQSTGLTIVTKGEWTADVSYTFTYNQSPIEAVIKPAGDYRKWLPSASTKKGEAGGKIGFNVELRDKKTGGKPKDVTATFTFKLLETSTEPGSCMNSPWSDTEPDLKILKAENPGLADVPEDGQSAKSKGKLTECPITVSCFDGGPRARLQIVADLSDGRTAIAHLEDGTEELPLPYDEDDNRIADAWEDQRGVKGQSAEVDDEQDPPGDHTNGDGLTLWEEYRGFLEDGKHIYGDVKKKDYFICDTVGGRVKPGIKLFEDVSKLEVHSDLTVEELGTDRVVNRNHGERPHVVDQHGILLGQRQTDGTCEAISGLQEPSTPKDIIEVVIDPQVSTTIQRGGRSYNLLASTVAHELLHACSVWHHGQCDRTVWWHTETEADGTKAVYEYDDPSDAGHPEKGGLIVPRREDGALLATSNWDSAKMVWLGMPGGQHSGHDDCVMRYDCSRGYVSGVVRYKLQPAELEIPGFGLCSSATGTGVNDAGRSPCSRYRDATKGSCIDQIRVKDPF